MTEYTNQAIDQGTVYKAVPGIPNHLDVNSRPLLSAALAKYQEMLSNTSEANNSMTTAESVTGSNLDVLTLGDSVTNPSDMSLCNYAELESLLSSDAMKERITKLRGIQDPVLQKKYKITLPWFACGRFDGRRTNANMIEMTALVIDIDFKECKDPVTGEKDTAAIAAKRNHIIKHILPNLEFVYMAFVSPLFGLKLIVRFNFPVQKEAEFKAIYSWVRQILEPTLDTECDHTDDPARATFLSWDADYYINPGAYLLPVKKVLSMTNYELRIGNTDLQSVMWGDLQSPPQKLRAHPHPDSRYVPRDSAPVSAGSASCSTSTAPVSAGSASCSPKVYDFPLKKVSWEDCRVRVEYLAAQRLSYKDWRDVGAALYDEFGDSGKALWNLFGDNPHYPGDTQAQLDSMWRSFGRMSSIHIASLLHIAKKYGFEGGTPPSPVAPLMRTVKDENTGDTEMTEYTEKENFKSKGAQVAEGMQSEFYGDKGDKEDKKDGVNAEIVTSAPSLRLSDSVALQTEEKEPDTCLRRNDGHVVVGNDSHRGGGNDENKSKSFLHFQNMMGMFDKVTNVPLEVERLPVFLQEYLTLTGKITDAQAGARLTAILPVMAANIGNRVYMENNGGRIFCNIWGVIIGPSTVSRKTTVLNLAKSTMQPFEDSLDTLSSRDFERETIILSNVTSAKLVELLSKNPNRLFFHNEIGAFLSEMGKQYNQGMKQKITAYFDGSSEPNMNMERCERIKNPALSLLAASTEGWFYSQLSSKSEQLSGFMQRTLYCIISNIDIRSLNNASSDTSEYREQLKGYDDIYQLFRTIPLPFRLKATSEAILYRDEVTTRKLEEIYALGNDPIMQYYGRIYDGYWYKLCILITLWKTHEVLGTAIMGQSIPEYFTANFVTLETAQEAMYMCDYFFNNTMPLLKLMSEQDKMASERKFVDLLCHKFGGRATHSEMMRFGNIGKKEIREVTETLIEMEVITVESGKNAKGFAAKLYVLDPVIMANLKD